jgi:hypothetical protein
VLNNIDTAVIKRLDSSSYYTNQLDESTDVVNLFILVVSALYINEGTVEYLLFCCNSQQCTSREDIFNPTNKYFQGNEVDCSDCTGTCSDDVIPVTAPERPLDAL